MLALGATAVAGYNALFLYGLELAPASDGAIIVPGLAPVFSMLIAWPVLGERIGGRGMAGLLLAFAGVTAVIQPTAASTETARWARCSSRALPAGASTPCSERPRPRASAP